LKTAILTLEVAWAGCGLHMTDPCKQVFTAALADFGVHLWRKVLPQKIYPYFIMRTLTLTLTWPEPTLTSQICRK